MKKIDSFKKIFTIITIILILNSCSDILLPSVFQNPRTDEGYLFLRIDNIDTSRTIMPTWEQYNISRYTLIFSATNKSDYIVERTSTTINQVITLATGNWNLEIIAYRDEEKNIPIAIGSLPGIVMESYGYKSESIKLKPFIENSAKGTFVWNIDYPADVISASMTITPYEGTQAEEQTLYFISDGYEDIVAKNNEEFPFELNTGYYRVTFNLSNLLNSTGREETLHIYGNMESKYEFIFESKYFGGFSVEVTSADDNGTGSLRYVIENAPDNSIISINKNIGTIYLESSLVINKSLIIEGNGVTITRSASWNSINENSHLLTSGGGWVTLRRIHFKDGRTSGNGAAIRRNGGWDYMNIESCIFSGNRGGYAILLQPWEDPNNWMNRRASYMEVRGCTFYDNEGAVWDGNNGGSVRLIGNLFFRNSVGIILVRTSSPSGNFAPTYNVADVAFGIGAGQTGWTAGTGDKVISTLPASFKTFKLLSGGGAENVVVTLPSSGYPLKDFYGNPITHGASAGAVQVAINGFFLELSVNTNAPDMIIPSYDADENGFFTGSVSLTANASTGRTFMYWLLNGNIAGNYPTLNVSSSAKVQAVFGITVNNFSDAPGSVNIQGTLRYALANAHDGDIIRFTEVVPNISTIQLSDSLPVISKNMTIEGNGIVLTSMVSFPILMIENPSLVNISRIHFKDGNTNGNGAAIQNSAKTLIIESCIFSNNRSFALYQGGGAINSSSSILIIKGCTFFSNSANNQAGAIYNLNNPVLLIGNLFYGNTAPQLPIINGQVRNNYYENNYITIPVGYNVIDISYGIGNTQSGWTLDSPGYSNDTTFSIRGITGVPINTTTFRPVNSNLNFIPTGWGNFPSIDFYGNTRIFPAAPGAVAFNYW
ncbi:MAG: hypothetical protein FWD13_05090 [Treponema sp.]|nr:hypothetical protein [Treponema sp.]